MEKRTENQAKEIKLIIASYTGEYEILTVVPKLGAQIENASGDDEVMDYIPDLVSQYFQVLHRYPPRLRSSPSWIGSTKPSRIWARKSTAIMRTLTITRGIPSRPGSDIR